VLTTSREASNPSDVHRNTSGAVRLDPECSGQSATAIVPSVISNGKSDVHLRGINYLRIMTDFKQ